MSSRDVCSPAASVQRLGLVGVGAGGDGSLLAADGHCAAWAIVACADAIVRQTASLGGGYAGHAICDGNIAASAIVAAADTSNDASTSICAYFVPEALP